MKLFNLFETSEYMGKDLIKRIIADCRPYFDLINNDVDNLKLYRGLQMASVTKRAEEVAKSVYIADVRKDREPLNTPVRLHKLIDSWMEENLGSKFRSQSIFCCGNYYTAMSFGTPHVIIPIGEFKYAWSPYLEDLYSDVEEIAHAANKANCDWDHAEHQALHTLNNADYRTNNLKLAISEYDKNEIMIECDRYYIIARNVYDNQFVPLFDLYAK